MFLNMVIYRFLNTTQFFDEIDQIYDSGTVWSSFFRLLFLQPQWILAVVTVLLYLTAEKISWKETAGVVLFCGFLLFCAQKTGAENVVSYLLLLPGVRYVSFEKLIKVYVGLIIFMTALTIISSRLGIIGNYTWYRWDGRTRQAFGFIYPTDFAAHIFFMILGYWYIRGRKISYIEMLLVLAASRLTMEYSIARCSSALIAVIAFAMLYNRLFSRRLKLERIILENMPLLMAMVTTAICLMYDAANPYIAWLNEVLSARLALVQRGARMYGFHLWGRDIPMIGNGGKSQTPTRYYFIDSAYMQLALLYGIILLAVVLVLLTIVSKKAGVQEQWVLLWIIALACVHGIIEQHLMELEYFPFFLAAFGTIANGQAAEEKKGFIERLHGKKK